MIWYGNPGVRIQNQVFAFDSIYFIKFDEAKRHTFILAPEFWLLAPEIPCAHDATPL